MCHDDVSLNCISRYKTLFFEKVEINKCIFFYKVIFKNIYIKKGIIIFISISKELFAFIYS